MNIYFMKELKKLKGDQKRLDDEVLHLKLENSNLTARLKTSQWQVMRLMDYFSQMAEQQQPAVHIPGQRYDSSSPLVCSLVSLLLISLSRPLRALDALPAGPSNAVESTNGSTNKASIPCAQGRAEQPMVVYNLSKSTPIVLTANTTFCQMIGYELARVCACSLSTSGLTHHDP